MDRTEKNDGFSKLQWDRSGLPPWTYSSDALFKLELDELFLTHWQIAGHISDVPAPGDYLTFDLGPERALIIRGDDGVLRGFHNLCRHRGSRVVAEERGHCKNALVCPFHGWVYNLDGTLRGPAQPRSYPRLDRKEWGLPPLEMEVWHGLIFVRFKSGPQKSVAEVMAPFDEALNAYRIADMVPADQRWSQEVPVNWKSMCDVDNEGYHVAMAHPALHDLYGLTYGDMGIGSEEVGGAVGTYKQNSGRRWSVRNYVKFSKGPAWLPEAKQKEWAYYGMFPNTVIIATPENIQYYQEIPLGTERAAMRGAIYRHKDEDRQQRLARYLTSRIDRETVGEDIQLSIWSHESMKSSAFKGFYLSDLERGVRWHHDRLRQLFPVMTLDKPPKTDDLSELNARMKSSHKKL